METIVVSDTNIFIDLIEIGLLDDLFSLPWEIHTTDLVMLELKDANQKQVVMEHKNKGDLHIKEYDTQEMLALARFHTEQGKTTKISFQDCSVLQYAKSGGYSLLTGDYKLRSVATKSQVDVHGIVYVIDKLVDGSLISKQNAASKLQELTKMNPRLPLPEIEKRIKLWQEDQK